MLSFSVVIPMYNERENVGPLEEQLRATLPPFGRDYEVILVDDGSTDGTSELLDKLASRDECVRVVHLRRNFGQSAAMQAGIDTAQNDVVVTMDGDLQNDPTDIGAMLERIEHGADLVHGWRKNRKDAWINRKLPSKIANWLISRTTGFPIHDLGCTLKAIRREIAQELDLCGEMHRFIPILAHRRGARCEEMVTKHHPRRFGTTKYGIGRTTRVVLDLVTVNFFLRYFHSPMKFFGRIGLLCAAIGAASAAATLGMKFWGGVDMTGNPLLLQTVLSAMLSVQFIGLGLLGEMSVRTHFASSGQKPYAIRRIVGRQEETPTLTIRRAA